MIKYYSTGCPQCNQIKAMMDNKGIEYEYIKDIDTVMKMAEKYNIMSAPFAEVFDEVMTAPKLMKYINSAQ
jgi:glutaredoxin